MLFPMTIVMMFLKGGNTRFLTTTAHSLGVSHLVRVQQYQRKLISHQEDNLPTHSSLVSTGCLKVSKNRNDVMKTSFLPKSNEIIQDYHTGAINAIITRSLYTFHPLFEVHLSTVTFGIIYSRASYSGGRMVFFLPLKT